MWQVQVTRKVSKDLHKLPKGVYDALRLLIQDIEQSGPVRGNWKNYGKLGPASTVVTLKLAVLHMLPCGKK